jgi:hypothetical protein
MCVSKEVSLGAFILCTIMCLYLFKRNKPNDRWVALFFIYIGCMQYLEYLMWSDQECSGKNPDDVYIISDKPITEEHFPVDPIMYGWYVQHKN